MRGSNRDAITVNQETPMTTGDSARHAAAAYIHSAPITLDPPARCCSLISNDAP
jgi:hypothetical protein